MASKIVIPLKVVAQTGTKQTGTVIFLHGSGDTGRGVYEWITHLAPDFNFPHLKIILPTAPPRPYTAMGGVLSNVWFDRSEISKRVKEDLTTIDLMAKEIVGIINKEVESGIPLNKIIIGGFSMGGALSFHVGYRFVPQLAGVFALSAFINDGSAVLEHLQSKGDTPLPPLFQWHGLRDELVPAEWGEETFHSLETSGVKGEFHKGQNALHELKKECLLKLHSWINTRIPEK